jgi:hypothetical protein
MTNSQHVYEVRPRKDKRGFDLISDVLPFGCLWYGEPDAISKANRLAWLGGIFTGLSSVVWRKCNPVGSGAQRRDKDPVR